MTTHKHICFNKKIAQNAADCPPIYQADVPSYFNLQRFVNKIEKFHTMGVHEPTILSGHEKASHTSMYFTAENATHFEPHKTKRSRKKSRRVEFHIGRLSKRNESSSSDDSTLHEEHCPPGVYNPVKRSHSQSSAGRYAPQLVQNLEEDRKYTEIHISSSKTSKKKCSHRRKVYRPIGTKDTSLQTDCDPTKTNKECQTSTISHEKAKVCYRGVECDLLKSHKHGSKCRGHTFPFVGESPSGNLKVPPQMVSFENEKISVLLADPTKTKLTHNEWKANHSIDFEVHRHHNNVNDHSNDKSHGRPTSSSKYCKNHSSQKSNQLGHGKAPCHKERPYYEKTDNLRNYTEEMKAWQSQYPMFNPDEQTNYTEHLYNPEKAHNARSIQNDRDDHNDIFKDLTPSPPPKIPPFPRESSPTSSVISKSQIHTSDNDDSSVQFHNVKHAESKGALDFMENLHYRIKRAIHPDMKVVIGNMEFPVHSVALQIHSKYFDNLRRPPEAIHTVELPESTISPDDFQHVMDWALTNERDRKLILTRDNVVGLYSTAQYLGIHELKSQCLNFVQEKVDAEDPKLIKLWEDAHNRPKTKELVTLLSQKLTKLFPKLYKTRQFLKLDVNELVMLLDSDDVLIESEMDIFDAAVRWLLYDWSNRKRHTVKVMSTIRFGLLSPLQLTQMRFLSEDKEAPDFKKIFSFDSVKRMLEDGKTYSVLKQSYAKRPGELNKWIRNTGVIPPKPRTHLDPELENLQRMPDPLVAMKDGIESINISNAIGNINNMKDAFKDITTKGAKLMDLKDDVMGKAQTFLDHFDAQVGQLRSSQEEANKVQDQKGSLPHITTSDESPARQSMLLLPDIPYTMERSKGSLNDDSGEYVNIGQKNNEIRAAVTIQRFARGFLARKKVHKMKQAAQVIQEALRAFRKKNRNDYKPLKEATGRKPLVTHQPSQSLQPSLMKNLDLPKDALLIFGGSDPKSNINPNNPGQEIFMYALDANIWVKVGKMPEPRTHFGIARIDKDVYVIGGTDPRYKTSKERNIGVKSVWRVNLRSGDWNYDSEFPKDFTNVRSHFGCVEKDGIIYAIGGNDMDSRALSTCEKYDPTYNSWTPIAPLDGPRLSMGAALFEDHIWIAGGTNKNPRMPVLKSVLCYDIRNNSWTAVRSLPLPRAFCNLVSVQGKLYLVGGAGQRDRNSKQQTSVPDIIAYDQSKDKWRDVGLLNTARHGHVSAAIGNNIIVLGGVNSTQMGAMSSVEIFDLSSSHSHKGRRLFQKMSGMGVLPLV